MTPIVQRYGTGAYRIGNVVRRNVVNRDEDVQFNAWTMLVVYRNDKESRSATSRSMTDRQRDIGRSVNLR